MPRNEILDDFNDGHKPRLTPFQRWVRIISFISWVAFLSGVFMDTESWPSTVSPLTKTALIVLSALYLFFPIPLFRSKGVTQHLVAHWVGAMMLGFILGFFSRFNMFPKADTYTLIAGFGSLAGFIGLIFFMIKKDMDRDERRFWMSMLIRLAIVIFLTSGAIVRFAKRHMM